jgi:hypothetical protein
MISLQSHASRKSVASVSGGGPGLVWCWFGGGPMWIAQGFDIQRFTKLTTWLKVRLSAPCTDGAGPAQAPMWIA